MIRPTNLQVAIAHLSSRIKQSLVAVLSVTFGISMYIFMNGFMTGVNDIQTELAFSTLAHVRIYRDLPKDRSNLINTEYSDESALIHIRNPKIIQYTEGIRNSEEVIQSIEDIPEITGIANQVNLNVFFRNGSSKVNGLISGVEPNNEEQLFEISEYVIEGSWFDLKHRSDGLIMGVGLAKKLSLGLNDFVQVNTADGVSKTYEIIGILEMTIAGIDNTKAFVNINSARQLVSKNRNYATDIQVNVTDFENATEIAASVREKTDLKVESWIESNGQLEAGNELRNIIAIAVSFTILIVAGFGIYNIMNMTVNEKIKEIAILKAMGFEGNDIIQIFLVQSVIIGMLGGLIGMLVGGSVSMLISKIPFEIPPLETLPMAYIIKDYAAAFGFGLVTTFIAGYLPAKKASRVDPVTIIRG